MSRDTENSIILVNLICFVANCHPFFHLLIQFALNINGASLHVAQCGAYVLIYNMKNYSVYTSLLRLHLVRKAYDFHANFYSFVKIWLKRPQSHPVRCAGGTKPDAEGSTIVRNRKIATAMSVMALNTGKNSTIFSCIVSIDGKSLKFLISV